MKMNKKVVGGLAGLVSLLIAGASNAAIIQLTPAVQSVSVGDPLSLTVHGTEFDTGVSSGSVSVFYDPTKLQFQSFSLSAGFIQISSNAVAGQIDIAAGTFGSVGTQDPGTGLYSFDFAQLNFIAIPPPATSSVSITTGAFGEWDDDTPFPGTPHPISGVVYEGASVLVGAVPVPAAVWLFGSGLLGLVGIARRREQA